MDKEEFESTDIDLKKNTFHSDDPLLDILKGYHNSAYLNIVVDLLFAYCSKSKDNMINGYQWLENNYGISAESYKYDYFTVVDLLN